jgi:hypothetical protein
LTLTFGGPSCPAFAQTPNDIVAIVAMERSLTLVIDWHCRPAA